MKDRVAIVTGANRGIGFEVCRQLAKKGFKVILTSRNEEKGQAACEELRKEGLTVDYHQCDVNDEASVKKLRDEVEAKYGRCDVLVNNAGIFPDTTDASGGFPSIFDSKIDTVRKAMETNVYGPILLCQAFVPLMKKNKYGRIVNFSSGMGQLSAMNGGCPAYRISKTSINAVTCLLADELKDDNILVNSLCPGWVKTDMGGPGATRELSEGADTAAWLAILPDDGPRGKFFRDRKEFPW